MTVQPCSSSRLAMSIWLLLQRVRGQAKLLCQEQEQEEEDVDANQTIGKNITIAKLDVRTPHIACRRWLLRPRGQADSRQIREIEFAAWVVERQRRDAGGDLALA